MTSAGPAPTDSLTRVDSLTCAPTGGSDWMTLSRSSTEDGTFTTSPTRSRAATIWLRASCSVCPTSVGTSTLGASGGGARNW